MRVLQDFHEAKNDKQNVAARSIASSHEDLHAVTSTSSRADLNSQNVTSKYFLSQGMDLCLEVLPTTTVRCHTMNVSNNF